MEKRFALRWPHLWRAAIIVGLGFLIYGPALHGGWAWDDTLYFTDNPLLRDPARVWKAWFAPGSFIEYYPLEETLQWLEWKMFGNETLGYHLINLALHLAGALLVWRLLAQFGLRWGWLGGLLFAVHPLNVDSVANIAEFKNVLSLPPFLLALCAYVNFEERRRPRDYFAALVLFLVAMLCKISMACFPFVMLLYVWWKRGMVRAGDLKTVAPFAVISLVLGLTTYWAGVHFEHLHFSQAPVRFTGGILSRIALIGLVLADDFGRFFLPANPLPMSPQWSVSPPAPLDFLPWPAGGAAFYFFWLRRKRWGRHALLGLGFFFILLLPFSGIVLPTYMAFSWTLDHLLYLPMIGLIGLVVAGLEQLCRPLATLPRRIIFTGLGVLVLALATESQDYAAQWVDSETLWTYTLAHNPGAWLAHYNLGNELRRQGRYDEAIGQYRETLRLDPGDAGSHNNLGMILVDLPGHLPEAIAEYEAALRLRPDFFEAHLNLANALLQRPDQWPRAIAEYRTALREKPSSVVAHYDFGAALARMPGRQAEARGQLEEALRLDPGFPPARNMLQALPP
jgi:tetratricopeptide (TPR) repeat protein